MARKRNRGEGWSFFGVVVPAMAGGLGVAVVVTSPTTVPVIQGIGLALLAGVYAAYNIRNRFILAVAGTCLLLFTVWIFTILVGGADPDFFIHLAGTDDWPRWGGR